LSSRKNRARCTIKGERNEGTKRGKRERKKRKTRKTRDDGVPSKTTPNADRKPATATAATEYLMIQQQLHDHDAAAATANATHVWTCV